MQTKIGSSLEVRFVLSIIVLVALIAPCTFAAAPFDPSPTPPVLSQKPSAAANPAVVETPPALSYTSYLLSPADRINAVAAGADSTLYVAGVRLPSVVAVDPTQRSAGEGKAFVARFSSDGSRLLFFTYVDSSGLSEVRALAVDAAGNAYVTGETHAENFPVRNPLQPECSQDASGRCSGDAFVAKLDGHGTILFSTYFGGSGEDAANAVAVDAQGNIYLAGSTDSTDLPVLKAVQSASSGNGDAFIAEIAADGSRVLFATYLGGTGADQARGIALDKEGNIYVTGQTASVDFPVSAAIQPECAVNSRGNCAGEAFVTKLAPAGLSFLYSTYLGGSGIDAGNAIAADEDSNAYVAGVTSSRDFPLAQPLQAASAGQTDAFVTKVAPDGSKFVFSTYVGGSGQDEASSIAIDPSHDVFLSGFTRSSNFPMQRPFQASCRRGSQGLCSVDAFVTVLDPTGSHLRLSSYLGGTGVDLSQAIAVDARGGIYSGGWTSSTDFPQAHTPQFSARETQLTGTEVAGGSFVAKINGIAPPPTVTCSSGTNNNNWVGTAGDNQWTTATNWSTGAVPISTNNVCIASTFTATITIGSVAAANQTIASLTSGAPISFTTGPLTVSGAATFSADLKISSGILVLNGTSSMTTLEMSGGTLAGSGALTISGLLTWSGGSMCTALNSTLNGCATSVPSTLATTTANGGITASGGGYLNGRTLVNTGTATYSTSAYIYLLYSSVVKNQSGATWNLNGDANIYAADSTETFNNVGTFEKTAGTSTSTIEAIFNNSGTGVSVNAATVNFTGGGSCGSTCAGPWSVASGATLQFGGGTFALSGDFTGAGTATFSGGTETLTGKYNVTGAMVVSGGLVTLSGTVTTIGNTLTVSGGTANFDVTPPVTITVTTMTMSSGIVAGPDTLTISGLLTWSGGSMCTALNSTMNACVAPTTLAVTNANGGITGSGGGYLYGRTLNNTKTATYSASGYIYMLDSAVVNNKSGATWNLNGDANIYAADSMETFNNIGTFEKMAGTSTSEIEAIFNNSGTAGVSVNTATVYFSGGGSCGSTCAGPWSVAKGATLQFASGTFAMSGGFSGAGTVNFSSGSETLTGKYDITGATVVSGGVVTFSGSITTVGSTLTVSAGVADFNVTPAITITVPTATMSGGIVAGPDTLTISGLLTWSGDGSMCTALNSTMNACVAPTGKQSVTNAKGGITGSGGEYLYGRTLNNSKTAKYSASGFVYLLDSAVVNNVSGATWNLNGDAQLYAADSTETFNNEGTFEKTAGTGTSSIETVFNNSGTVKADAANITFSGTFTQTGGSTLLGGGSISLSGATPTLNEEAGNVLGIGTITGNLTNTTGLVSPSPSSSPTKTGTLTLSSTAGAGSYTQATGGTLLIDIAGAGAGQADELAVGGAANLNGTIDICLVNGYNPAVGTVFNNIMTYGSHTGTFSTVETGTYPGGWTLAYNATSVSATYNGSPVVKLPSSVSFPSQLINTTGAAQSVKVTNSGTKALSISGITLGGTDAAEFAIMSNGCGANLAAGASCTVKVTFTPTALGKQSADLEIADNACGSPQAVPLSGKGTEITLSPSPASFGKVAVGSTSTPVTVTLTNNGTTSVTIDTVTITGTDAGDFAITSNLCTSAVVAGSGGTCTITLTFTPGATGSRAGTLNVTDTDSGSPQTDTLKGTGTT